MKENCKNMTQQEKEDYKISRHIDGVPLINSFNLTNFSYIGYYSKKLEIVSEAVGLASKTKLPLSSGIPKYESSFV